MNRRINAYKGLSLLLMIFYLSFSNIKIFKNNELTGAIYSNGAMVRLAQLCYLGLFLFFCMLGYELAMQIRENNGSIAGYSKVFIGKYAAYLKITFLSILIIIIGLGITRQMAVVYEDWGPDFGNVSWNLITNCLGIAPLAGNCWLLPITWQYLVMVVICLIICPLLYKICSWFGSLALLAVICLIPCLFQNVIGETQMVWFLLPFSIGIILAEKDVLNSLKSIAIEKKLVKRILIYGSLIVAFGIAVLAQFWDGQVIICSLLSICVIFICELWLFEFAMIERLLNYVGMVAGYCWLVYYSIYLFVLSKRDYLANNMWLILIIAIIITAMIGAGCYFLVNGQLIVIVKKLLEKVKHPNLLLALTLTIIGFVFIKCFTFCGYLTNDDGAIQNLLASATTASPWKTHQFISAILGYPISLLYAIVPIVQWWYVFGITILLIATTIIHYTFIRINYEKTESRFLGVVFSLMVDLGFIWFSMSNVSFTIVPAIFGGAIICVVLLTKYVSSKRRRIVCYIFSFLGVILMLSYRYATGQAVLCFIVLMLLYTSVKRTRRFWKSVLVTGMIAVILVGVTFSIGALNKHVTKSINGEAFVELNSARSGYIDYPHDGFKRNTQIYDHVGWDRPTYLLVSNWCFMADYFTADSLNYLSENSITIKTNDLNRLNMLEKLVDNNIKRVYIYFWIFSMIVMLSAIRKKKAVWSLIISLINGMGAAFLLGYLLYKGRIIDRSVAVVIIPSIITNFLLFLDALDLQPMAESNKKAKSIFVAFLIIFIVPVCHAVFSASTYSAHKANNDYTAARDAYVSSHPENFYIGSARLLESSTPRIRKDKPENYMYYGGCTFGSAEFYRILEKNGFSNLTGAIYKDERVYLLNTNLLKDGLKLPTKIAIRQLYEWLEIHYNLKGIVLEDRIPNTNMCVYKFIFDLDSESDFTYYTIKDGVVEEKSTGSL